MKKTMKKVLATAFAGMMALSAVVVADAPKALAAEASAADASAADASADDATAGGIDFDGEYNAYIYIQGPKFTFRDAWENGSTGGRVESPLFNQLTFQGDTAEGKSVPATFNDTHIAGNGTYTVSATGIEWPEDEFSDREQMNLIGVSFDMPVCDKITISDVVLKIDGTEVPQNAFTLLEEDSTKDFPEECYNLLIQNMWNEKCADLEYYKTPFSEISVTFTINGFNYDKAADEAPADDATVEEGSDDSSKDDSATTAAEKKDDKKDDKSFPVVPVVIGVVVVIAAAAAVVIKKKK